MFQTKVVEKIETHISCWNTFFSFFPPPPPSPTSIMLFMRWCGKIFQCWAGHRWQWHKHIAYWLPKARNTPSGCVILFAVPLQNGCMNVPQCYVICSLPVLFSVVANRVTGQRRTVYNVGFCTQASIQRITRYPLLLAHGYKVTRTDDETRELVHQSQHNIEHYLELINSVGHYIAVWNEWSTCCYRHFRFKPWTGSRRQGPVAVNDLTRKHSRGVRAIRAFKRLSPDLISINCQVGRILTARVFVLCNEIWDFCHIEDIILSVGVRMSDPPQNVH
jgi:hypothetical protein